MWMNHMDAPPQAGRLNSARFAHTLWGNFSIRDRYTFLLQHLFLFFQASGITRQLAIRADHAMAGNGRSVGIFVERIADSAIAAGAELAGEIGVAEDLALGNAGGQGPDFLVEGHLRCNLSGANGGFDFGHDGI